nr:unnamed protein product [Callosobruchus analis]
MVLRWGIAGAGRISHDFVTAVQSAYPKDHKVVAVAARSEDGATVFAKEHQIPKAYGGYEKLAMDHDVDIVYVGNLNTQHFSTCKMMLEQGNHVLCEKPFMMNEKQTRRLIKLARSRKLFIMEAVWSRCFPVYHEAKRMMDSGEIGDVLFAAVHFGHALQHVERHTSMQMGGGAILDLGVYVLQFQQYVFRNLKPLNVAVNGTKGTLKIPDFWCPTRLITPTAVKEYPLPRSEKPYLHHNSAGLCYQAEEARKCIISGQIECPHMTHAETIELARLMDLLRKEIGVIFPEDSQEF